MTFLLKFDGTLLSTKEKERDIVLEKLPCEAVLPKSLWKQLQYISISCLNGYVFYFCSTWRWDLLLWLQYCAMMEWVEKRAREEEIGRKSPMVGIVYRGTQWMHSENIFNEFLSAFYDKRWDSWLCVIVDLFFYYWIQFTLLSLARRIIEQMRSVDMSSKNYKNNSVDEKKRINFLGIS